MLQKIEICFFLFFFLSPSVVHLSTTQIFLVDVEEEDVIEEEGYIEDGYLEEEEVVSDDESDDNSSRRNTPKGRSSGGPMRVKRTRVFRIARGMERQRGEKERFAV